MNSQAGDFLPDDCLNERQRNWRRGVRGRWSHLSWSSRFKLPPDDSRQVVTGVWWMICVETRGRRSGVREALELMGDASAFSLLEPAAFLNDRINR